MLLAMIKTESGFRSKAKSSEGAVGLLQVIPRWHKDKLAGRNPYLNQVSIEVGSQILYDCFTKHNRNTVKALTCYSSNGGKRYFNSVSKNQVSIESYVSRAYAQTQTFLASN